MCARVCIFVFVYVYVHTQLNVLRRMRMPIYTLFLASYVLHVCFSKLLFVKSLLFETPYFLGAIF